MQSLLLDSRMIFLIHPGGLGMRISGKQITNFDQFPELMTKYEMKHLFCNVNQKCLAKKFDASKM